MFSRASSSLLSAELEGFCCDDTRQAFMKGFLRAAGVTCCFYSPAMFSLMFEKRDKLSTRRAFWTFFKFFVSLILMFWKTSRSSSNVMTCHKVQLTTNSQQKTWEVSSPALNSLNSEPFEADNIKFYFNFVAIAAENMAQSTEMSYKSFNKKFRPRGQWQFGHILIWSHNVCYKIERKDSVTSIRSNVL